MFRKAMSHKKSNECFLRPREHVTCIRGMCCLLFLGLCVVVFVAKGECYAVLSSDTGVAFFSVRGY